ncbi:NUDIX hydrolase [Candidatus Woesearchaeota archaeon]|nr:NUDIX hydrolase [Candidatus Woesearchaeota archaeon]
MKTTTNAFIFHKNKLLLILHKKANIWMHPGGHVEENETITKAIHREIKEETNLDIKILNKEKEPDKPFMIWTHKKNNEEIQRIEYIAEPTNPKEIKIQEEEILNYKWITKKELQEIKTIPRIKELAIKSFEEYEEIKKQSK